VFAAFDRFRVLCAVRETARGLQAINQRVGEHLQRAIAGAPRWPGHARCGTPAGR
jgi:hypothetical protein